MTAFIDRSETITAVLGKIFLVHTELDAGIAKTKNEILRYSYHENEDVLTACRRAMLKHGLMLMVSSGAVTYADKRYFQEYVFTLTDYETGEYVSFGWGGVIPTGVISTKTGEWVEDDKAIGKCKSYSEKNWLLAFFMIGTPDQDTAANPAIPTQRPQYPTPSQPAETRRLAQPANAIPMQMPVLETDNEITPTDEAFDNLKSAFPDTAPIGKSHLIKLHTLLKEMGIGEDEKHEAVKLMTGGTKDSTKALTIAEYEHFMLLLKVYHLGMLGSAKWNEAAKDVASKSSLARTDNWMELNHAEIRIAYNKVCKLYADHKKEIPAQYANL